VNESNHGCVEGESHFQSSPVGRGETLARIVTA
jgi:hypothetical protein